MWHEFTRINENTFWLGRMFDDELYSILDGNGNVISSHKIIRWFKNGFLLAKAEEFFEWESRDGVDLSYTDFIYTVLDTDLNGIHSVRVRNNGQQPSFLDFVQGNLILSHGSQFGAISETGETVIEFKFSADETDHRLTLKRPLDHSSVKNLAHNEATKIIYNSRLSAIQDTTKIKKFISDISNLISPEEKVYNLLLRKYSYAMAETFSDKPSSNLLPYDNSEFYLCKLDISIAVEAIQKITKENDLSISYWDKYNLSHSTKNLIDDLNGYFDEQDKPYISQRLIEIEHLANSLNIKKLSLDKLKEICKTVIPKIDSLEHGKMKYDDYLKLMTTS